jgi:type II secretory pathway pseudopilin PulG
MFSRRRPRPEKRTGGFSLLEVLITVALILIVLVVLLEFAANVDRLWKTTATDPFAEAENAFENVAAQIAGATLEPYQDYADATGAFRTASSPASFTPDHAARRSDLAFVCGSGATWLAGSGRMTAGDGVFYVSPQGYTRSTRSVILSISPTTPMRPPSFWRPRTAGGGGSRKSCSRPRRWEFTRRRHRWHGSSRWCR